MNEKFFELPEEKRLRILNAGFEVFAGSDYPHASTEKIAQLAGISKGLLFYYFHNKKALYLYLLAYAKDIMLAGVVDARFGEITDAFELMEYAAGRKCAVMEQNPYLMDFFTRAFYSQKEEVSPELDETMTGQVAAIYSDYFANVDFSKFRPDVDPRQIIRMMIWMTDGYLHEQQRAAPGIELSDLMAQFHTWTRYFKRIAYKEEYLT